MAKADDLIAYLFERQPHVLSGTLMQWLQVSTRFTAFVETYRDKVRKKIRLARDAESAMDLLGELEVAYCLLENRSLVVAYEPYASAKTRGPDFGVTYRTNLLFNVEVARIRRETSTDPGRIEERILRIFLDKLGQMQPGMSNVLIIHARPELARAIDLGRLMQDIKLKAERRDPAFYAITRYEGPALFYKDFLHLSAILLWTAEMPPWINKQARPVLPERVLRLVSSLRPSVSQVAVE